MQFYMYLISLFDANFSYNTGTDVNVVFYVFLYIHLSVRCYTFLYSLHLCRRLYSFRRSDCRSYAVCSVVSSFVRSLLSVMLAEFTSKVSVLSGFISPTTQ